MEELKKQITEQIDVFPGRAGIEIFFMEKGERLSYRENERFHAASIIKIPIFYEVLKQIEEGRLQLDTEYPLPEEEIVGGAGILQLFHPGLKLILSDLMHLMIDVSDNTATNMIIDIVGKDSVNRRLEELGCKNTFLARKLMKIVPGLFSYTSARDTVILLENIYSQFYEEGLPVLRKQQFNDCLSRDIRFCRKCGVLIGASSNCEACKKPVNELEIEEPVFAHKTGEITGVVHDSGIWEFPGTTVIISVLTDSLPDNRNGKNFQAKIGRIINKYLK